MTTAAGCDGRVAAHPPPALAALASAGVLAAGDVQIASRLCALAGEDRDDVLRAAALAARAPRLGHVCVDLADVGAMVVAEAATAGADVPALPHPSAWRDALAASPLVAVGNADDGPRRALRLDGNLLYLDRYWRDERELAAALRARSHPAPGVDFDLLGRGLTVLWREDLDDQREAAALGVMRRLTVIGGGPGTGKTTTIARMLALLDAQLGGVSPRTVALAAPTGKAAQRMQEAVHDAAREMPVAPAVRGRLMALEGRTVHRLLRSRWGSQTRFRHDAGNPLPHDVVIVDEASMMSLPLMARLVDALRADARLVLVGDPDQLASVEAGSVLGDIMGPARERPVRSAATLLALRAAGAVDADRGEAGEPPPRPTAWPSCVACTGSAAASPAWPTRSAGETPTRPSPSLRPAAPTCCGSTRTPRTYRWATWVRSATRRLPGAPHSPPTAVPARPRRRSPGSTASACCARTAAVPTGRATGESSWSVGPHPRAPPPACGCPAPR